MDALTLQNTRGLIISDRYARLFSAIGASPTSVPHVDTVVSNGPDDQKRNERNEPRMVLIGVVGITNGVEVFY